MRSWPEPEVVALADGGRVAVSGFDSGVDRIVELARGGTARMYACGITPYDATHIGHANTYVAFDLLVRAWLDAGTSVEFAENITDVDDPLLERARDTSVDWRELAAGQTALFCDDMAALRVVPPSSFQSVSEAMPEIIAAITKLVETGAAYPVPPVVEPGPVVELVETTGANSPVVELVETTGSGPDFYFDLTADPEFGTIARLSEGEMLKRFSEMGGDPDRPGKRGALDPLLWRARRPDEPSWDGGILGWGRPGWHIGCAVIAHCALGPHFDVAAGGTDLLFPHQEMSASLARVLFGDRAHHFLNSGMVAYRGKKMSKSLGNLVFVSQLIADGVDPMAIRLAILAHHYRSDWEWTDAALAEAEARLTHWRANCGPDKLPVAPTASVASNAQSDGFASETVATIRNALADDLNAPAAIEAVECYLAAPGRTSGGDQTVAKAIDSLLGVKL
ncbi:MAG: cysteine--1-D-myo-inosityl 2-amino-2-deoxy-alpha-D-glucopyranoside ligase [Promicromonosporaceae bacterium]|nr:cysteine--1-D-myo-inosityl 2-amino-2-deoxy-alpha-D-glucopyranoside ligase [Promicromonosporaceae bacterium]